MSSRGERVAGAAGRLAQRLLQVLERLLRASSVPVDFDPAQFQEGLRHPTPLVKCRERLERASAVFHRFRVVFKVRGHAAPHEVQPSLLDAGSAVQRRKAEFDLREGQGRLASVLERGRELAVEAGLVLPFGQAPHRGLERGQRAR